MLGIPSATELPRLRTFRRLGLEPWYPQHHCKRAEERLQVTSTSLCLKHNRVKCLCLSQGLINPQHCDWLGLLRSVCGDNRVKAMPAVAV